MLETIVSNNALYCSLYCYVYIISTGVYQSQRDAGLVLLMAWLNNTVHLTRSSFVVPKKIGMGFF